MHAGLAGKLPFPLQPNTATPRLRRLHLLCYLPQSKEPCHYSVCCIRLRTRGRSLKAIYPAAQPAQHAKVMSLWLPGGSAVSSKRTQRQRLEHLPCQHSGSRSQGLCLAVTQNSIKIDLTSLLLGKQQVKSEWQSNTSFRDQCGQKIILSRLCWEPKSFPIL